MRECFQIIISFRPSPNLNCTTPLRVLVLLSLFLLCVFICFYTACCAVRPFRSSKLSLSLFTPFRPSLHPATPFTQSQAAATTKATTKQQPAAAAAATFLLVLLSVTVVNVLLLLLLPGTVKGVGVRKTLKKTLSLLCAFTRKHGCFQRKRLETINLLLPLFCFFSFSYTFFYRWFLYFF